MFIQPSYEKPESSFWRVPKLISVEMRDQLTNSVVRALHSHNDRIEITLIRKGHGVHTIDGKCCATKAGDILIYNAGVLHDECVDTKQGMEVLWCTVSDVKFGDEPDNLLIPEEYSSVLQGAACYHEAEALMVMLITEKNSEVQRHLLQALLLMLRDEAMKPGPAAKDERMQLGHHIQLYLDEHFREEIHLRDVAQHFHMNAEYLSRVFRKTVGYSPMQYVTRRRIGEAQSWLVMTDKMVTDIAFLVGYNSVGNFHAAFLKAVGMTPQKYREQCKDPRGQDFTVGGEKTPGRPKK